MIMYVLECIITKGDNIVMETVGIYSQESLAKKFKKLCIADLSPKERKYIIYEYREMDVDTTPGIITTSETQQNMQDFVDDILLDLVKKGYVEQYVDVDGSFKYSITDKGKKDWKPEQNTWFDFEPEEDDEEIF